MIVRNESVSGGLKNVAPEPQKSEKNQEIKKEDSTKTAANSIESEEVRNELDREAKVRAIKQKIDDGLYKIDLESTSDKMAQDLLPRYYIFFMG